jgi:hypothetical protein
VNEAIDEVILGEAFKAETLASHIAERVRDRQGGRRAEVAIAARYPEYKPTPVSGLPTQEIYTLFGSAVASARGTRRLVGVEAQGMTACPCAQELVMERSQERLREDGFTDDEIARVFDAVPVATHNQYAVPDPWPAEPGPRRRRVGAASKPPELRGHRAGRDDHHPMSTGPGGPPPAETVDCRHRRRTRAAPRPGPGGLLSAHVLRLRARPGGTQRPRRWGVDALVPVVPANAIARGRCFPHHLLNDARPRAPLGRLRFDLDAIPNLQLHSLTSDSSHTG